MTYTALHTLPVRRTSVGPPRVDDSLFTVLNGRVSFNGDCETCRPFCASICCRGYSFIALTEEEATSGRYIYKEVDDQCGCDVCIRMRKEGLRYVLRKRPDGACVHLDGAGKCSIYDHRPETCRAYSCVNVAFRLVP